MATQCFSNGIPTGMPKCGVRFPARSFGVRNPALVKVRGVEKNEAWIGELLRVKIGSPTGPFIVDLPIKNGDFP